MDETYQKILFDFCTKFLKTSGTIRVWKPDVRQPLMKRAELLVLDCNMLNVTLDRSGQGIFFL